MTTPLSPPKSRRRWFQYSLRTLLVVTTLCAIACSWLGVELQQARRQREAVVALEKLGGTVRYDWQFDTQGYGLPSPQPPGQPLLRRLLGDDFFQSAHAVYLNGTQVGDSGLENFKGMSQLDALFLNDTPVTGAGLEHLLGLGKLRRLHLSRTQVGDADLKHFEGMSQLEELYLDGTDVTDAGLLQLKGLNRLEVLFIGRTQVTDAGIEKLQSALPKCSIYH
jgi:hypothetical protein